MRLGKLPRLLIYAVVFISPINFIAILARPPQDNPEYNTLVELLEWRDPAKGKHLNLPVNRQAPPYIQIQQLQNLQLLDLWGDQLHHLPSQIGVLHNLRTLDWDLINCRLCPLKLAN